MKYGVVHYNTPELTTCLIASVIKHDANAYFYVFENSDSRKLVLPEGLCNNICILNNSNGNLIDFNKLILKNQLYLSRASIRNHKHYGSLKHAASVQYLIDYIKDSFILLDSDVLIKKLPLELFNENIACDFFIKDGQRLRVLPFLCYIHYPSLLSNNLKFFDITRFDACYIEKDTGGSFCKDIIDKKINVTPINLQEYIIHFGNGSWRGNKVKSNLSNCTGIHWAEFLVDNKDLWR